ncbi:MAG: sel1 repeat family protein [Alphaproteobacteria bacterium]|nr:sel1 repeat family protein [Alphaproteobacteria bacterium]
MEFHTDVANSPSEADNVGWLYLSDEFDQDSRAIGLKWLSRTADLGNRFVPALLGRLHRDGKLVEWDHGKALAFLERSADFGLAMVWLRLNGGRHPCAIFKLIAPPVNLLIESQEGTARRCENRIRRQKYISR